MTPTEAREARSTGDEILPQFEGFPYLVTRVVPALYHIILLPADAPRSSLLGLAQAQVNANRLDVCVVLAREAGVFFFADGRIQQTNDTPRGGTLLTGRLALSVELLDTSEILARQAKLDRIVEHARRKGSYIVPTMRGGRAAAPDEMTRLAGAGPDGAPRGLGRCQQCGDWRGVCLDTSEQHPGTVVTVHCPCENHNRCARCGGRLYGRRLNANFYEPRDRRVWHVPGFCGLSHNCSARSRIAVL